MKKYDLPERIWYGAPAPLKTTAGGIIAAYGANGMNANALTGRTWKTAIKSEFFAVLHQALLDDALFSDLGWHRTGSNFGGDKTNTPFDQPPPPTMPLRKPGSAHPIPDFGKGSGAWLQKIWWTFRQI